MKTHMEKEALNPPVLLVNRKTGHIYEHQSGQEFKNLATGKVGEITKEKAKAGLVMPIKLNYLVDKNPEVLKLLREFGLQVALNE